MKDLINQIAKQLEVAGIDARVIYSQGMISIAAEDDSLARDVLGQDRFTFYMNDVEVVIV